MQHRYFLSIDNARFEVFPQSTAALKLPTAREKDQIFYRKKLQGNVVFIESDFAHLYSLEKSEERCTEIKFTIESRCNGGDPWAEAWRGFFSCNDVKWDRSKCTATVTPKPDDKYRFILEEYGKEFNVLAGTEPVQPIEVRLDFKADFEFKNITLHGLQFEEKQETWAIFLESTYFIEGWAGQRGTTQDTQIIYRLVTTRPYEEGVPADLSNDGWTIIDDNPSAQEAKYAKPPDLYNFKPYTYRTKGDFDKYPDLLQIPMDGVFDTSKFIEVSGPGGANSDKCGNGLNFRKRITDETRCIRLIWAFGTFTYNRNRNLMDVVRYLSDATAGPELAPADNLELSQFFNAPVNYVTEKPNTLVGLQVASLSDVIGYTSSEVATKAEWSLKAMFTVLRQMFRVYWDITDDGKLRIEHESFYQLQGAEDLTVYEKQLRSTDQYEYVKSEFPRYQRLEFQNAFNTDFAEGEIEYFGICINKEEGQDTEAETVNNVTTDLEYLIVSGGTTGQEGFVLMLTEGGEVLAERGEISGVLYPNAGLSAANLVSNYYTHNRVLGNGAVNRKPRTFKSIQKTKKQMPLTVPICCEHVNPYARFISTLGSNAELDTMTYSLTTGSVTFVLLHESYGEGAVEFGRQFDNSFSISFR